MLFKRVDGVLILSLRLHEPERELLRRLAIPVVTVGVPDPHWPCVRIDDLATTQSATEHLIDLGHRRIGYVGGDSVPSMNFPTPADRSRGFRDTMARHGLDVDPSTVVMGDWSPHSGLVVGRELLSRPRPALRGRRRLRRAGPGGSGGGPRARDRRAGRAVRGGHRRPRHGRAQRADDHRSARGRAGSDGHQGAALRDARRAGW